MQTQGSFKRYRNFLHYVDPPVVPFLYAKYAHLLLMSSIEESI